VSTKAPLPQTAAFPRSRVVESGGIRRTAITLELLTRILEWGTDKAVPLDPPNGLQYLDARLCDGRLELLVRSPSFVGGESATWETAEWWNPPFRRVEAAS